MSGRRRPSPSYAEAPEGAPSEASAKEGLSDRQRRFVDEYLIDLNIAAAARRSGYSPATAHAPDKLLTPAVNAAIEAAMDDRARRTRLRADLVVTELARLAFANLHDFIVVEPDGAPRIDFRNIDRNDAAALQSVSVDYYRPAPIRWRDKQRALEEGRPIPEPQPYEDGAAPPRRVRIALHDKRACLWDLARHLGVTPAGEAADQTGAQPDVTFTRIVTGVPRAHDPDGRIGVIWRKDPDGAITRVDEQAVIDHYLPRASRKAGEDPP